MQHPMPPTPLETDKTVLEENFNSLIHAQLILCLGECVEQALFLADKGLNVEVLHHDSHVLLNVRKRAKEHYTHIKARHTLFDRWKPSMEYDAIVCYHFPRDKQHQKILFEKSFEALRPKGLFIAELLSESHHHFKSGGEHNLNLLYNFNDVLSIIASLPCETVKLAQEIVLLPDIGRASVIRMVLRKKAEH